MKILWFWPHPHREVSGLALAALTPGDDLTVQALSAYDAEALGGVFPYEVVRDLPDPVVRGGLRRMRSLSRALRRLLARRRLVSKCQPDVVHVQTLVYELDAFDLRRLARRVAVVAVVHDVTPHVPRLPGWAQAWCHRRVYGSPVELVVYHQWLASRLTEGFGVDPDRLHVLPLALDAHRRTSPRPVDGTVLFFGSLRRNKGLDVLLAALNILDREDVRCVIAGAADDATYQRLRAAVASSSSEIRLELGHVTDERKWELFDAASVVVLPYTAFESQSGVLADAYAARRPVVVTDVGALGDAVRQDGTGVVVTPRDPRALADGLREVLSGPSARYRDALDAAAARQSRDVVGRRLRDVYDAAVARRVASDP